MKNNHRFRLDIWGVITLVILGLYLLFMVYPLGNLIRMAFYDDNGFTLGNFIEFFSRSYYSSTLSNSFKVSLAATVTSLLVGVPMAYFFSMYQIKGKKTLRILIIISSMSAPFVERGPLANSVVATVAPMVTAAMISPTPMRPPPFRQ